ncbi:MAG: zf-HC2 domain-containing protein [Actinomycetota bacterium]|nr:zf-HC2 domain-containing protein [Actinomycetota bacterium]
MTHPDDLLASYLDGTLDPRQRAEIDAHLAGCERCRADLRSALRARSELRGAPEAEMPPDLRERILATTASRPVSAPTAPTASLEQVRVRRRPAPAAWLAGIAVVAAVLIGFFVFAGLQGTSSPTVALSGRAAESGGNAPAPAFNSGGGAPGGLVIQPGMNYDEAAIQQLAASAAAGKTPATPAQSGASSIGDPSAATACLTKGAKISGSELAIQLIQAKFGGKPAYLGIFRLSVPGDAPDRVEVWVVSKADCSVLSFAQQLVRG